MASQLHRQPTWQWDPWSDFRDFERAMNRVFGDMYPTRAEYPPVNIWRGKDDIVVTAELCGIEPDELDISVHENVLTLRCSPKEGEQGAREGQTYHRRECVHQGFSRSLRLPFDVDGDKVEANIQNGILKLTLPQSEASKPKKVQVRAT